MVIPQKPVNRSLIGPENGFSIIDNVSSEEISLLTADPSVTADETFEEETSPPATNPHERHIQQNSTPSPEHERYVKWGIVWATPLLIVLWTVVGCCSAIGHHIYY